MEVDDISQQHQPVASTSGTASAGLSGKFGTRSASTPAGLSRLVGGDGSKRGGSTLIANGSGNAAASIFGSPTGLSRPQSGGSASRKGKEKVSYGDRCANPFEMCHVSTDGALPADLYPIATGWIWLRSSIC